MSTTSNALPEPYTGCAVLVQHDQEFPVHVEIVIDYIRWTWEGRAAGYAQKRAPIMRDMFTVRLPDGREAEAQMVSKYTDSDTRRWDGRFVGVDDPPTHARP
ncbi:hypothetical protein [Sphaerisporangium aureirubrum]|uniref:Uncharacterized protein n=1 Tax=Sphaerisporangium aureirubrum TaxID=1544736 RepID=A0ABW1NDC4_9ACTN